VSCCRWRSRPYLSPMPTSTRLHWERHPNGYGTHGRRPGGLNQQEQPPALIRKQVWQRGERGLQQRRWRQGLPGQCAAMWTSAGPAAEGQLGGPAGLQTALAAAADPATGGLVPVRALATNRGGPAGQTPASAGRASDGWELLRSCSVGFSAPPSRPMPGERAGLQVCWALADEAWLRCRPAVR